VTREERERRALIGERLRKAFPVEPVPDDMLDLLRRLQ
jgi:hypothetical protein